MPRKEKTGVHKQKSRVRKIKSDDTSDMIYFSNFFRWRTWFIMEEEEDWNSINIDKNGGAKPRQKK